jgi:hypothetical protein
MNTIQIVARFESQPNDNEKNQIENELREFLLNITELEEITVSTKNGSFWIIVGGVVKTVTGWLALETSNWGLQKLLDKLKDKISFRLSKPSKTSSAALASLSQSTANLDYFDRLGKTAYNLNNLAVKTGATQISLCDWSEDMGKGRIIKVRKSAREFSLELIQTDSRDDFDTRITS